MHRGDKQEKPIDRVVILYKAKNKLHGKRMVAACGVENVGALEHEVDGHVVRTYRQAQASRHREDAV